MIWKYAVVLVIGFDVCHGSFSGYYYCCDDDNDCRTQHGSYSCFERNYDTQYSYEQQTGHRNTMADLLEKDGDEKRSRLRKYADIETIMSRCQNIHHHHSVNRFYEHQEGMKIVYDLLTSIDPLINFDEWKRNPSNGKNLVFKLLSSFGQLMKGPHCGNTVVRDFLEQLDPVFRYLATTETAWIDTQKVTYEVIKIIMDFMLKNTGMGGIKRQHWADESLLPGLCCAESHFDGTPDKADDEEVI